MIIHPAFSQHEESALEVFNEEVWPSTFDDREIDDIIWEEIKNSTSRGDFICYQIHRPQKGRHIDEAVARLEELEGGERTPIGYGRAVKRIRKLAESGNAGAMFHMGKLSVHGIGMPQDMQAAEAWYLKAIAAGEMRACCNLGWIYQYGFGIVAPNKDEAFRLLSLGAESGVGAAKASIGLMLLVGDGRPAEPDRGVRLLEEAFAGGYNNAANHLADALLSGQHIPRDVDAAHEWLSRAAATGDERTMAILGHYLVTGSHGKTDVAQGLLLMHKAIENDYVPAYLWMGNLYRHGQGVERDLTQAKTWYERGVEAGNTGCNAALASLEAEKDVPTNTGPAKLH